MSAGRTSAILEDVERAVALGAPVLVTGVHDDAVLAGGEVVSLRAGIRRALERAGIPTVAWVDASEGVHGADPAHAERLRTLGVQPGLEGWPLAVRGIQACVQQPVGVVLKDPALLFGDVPDGQAVAHVAAGAAAAAVAEGAGIRNSLVVLADGANDIPAAIRGLAGAVTISVPLPTEADRLAALRALALGFHGAADLERGELIRQIRWLASATPGMALVGLEQLRQASVRLSLPI